MDKFIISIATHPPRFKTLIRNLETVISQDIRPHFICIGIYDKHYAEMPDAIKDYLYRKGFCVIQHPANIKGYLKLIPAAIRFGDKYEIVTMDDDYDYHPGVVSELFRCRDRFRADIACNTAAYPVLLPDGTLKPFPDWPVATKPVQGRRVMAIGSGGVLYPRKFMPMLLRDPVDYTLKAEHNDDVYFWYVAMRNNLTTATSATSLIDSHVHIPGTNNDEAMYKIRFHNGEQWKYLENLGLDVYLTEELQCDETKR